MFDQESFGNLTTNEEEVQETFIEENRSGSTESTEMSSEASESTETTEQTDTLSNQISIEKQSNDIIKSNCPKRLNSSNIEPLKGAVVKQYRKDTKQTQNKQRKQQSTEILRHFLITEWRKRKNELNNPRNTSNAPGSEDDRIKRFAKLKPVIKKALLFDIAVELDVQDFTHYDKRTSFLHIDFFKLIISIKVT